jgi:hypothetical protein
VCRVGSGCAQGEEKKIKSVRKRMVWKGLVGQRTRYVGDVALVESSSSPKLTFLKKRMCFRQGVAFVGGCVY